MNPPLHSYHILACLLALFSTALHAQEAESSAELLFEKAIYEADTAGNLPKAIELYEQLLADQSLSATTREAVLFRLGRALTGAGKYADAAKVFEASLKQFPNGVFADQARERLRKPKAASEIAVAVSMMGLWETPSGFLELMPGGLFQRLPHPVDAENLSRPSPPTAQGSYEIDGNSITLVDSKGPSLSFQWSLPEGKLHLTDKDGTSVIHTRARRPFRFPMDVAEPRQVAALMNLKAAEATPLNKFLTEGGKPAAALEVIGLSDAVDAELRRLTKDTTVELMANTGLAILELIESLLAEENVNGARTGLQAFTQLRWADGQDTRVGPYSPDPSHIVGTWKGFLHGKPMTMNFTSQRRWENPSSMAGQGPAPTYKLNETLLSLVDSPYNQKWFNQAHFLINRKELALYDERDGPKIGHFHRSDSSPAGRFDDYFGDHALALDAAISLTSHARFRTLLIDYFYQIATYCEGTTAGLLARTAVRQMLQVEAAYLAHEHGKASALRTAFQGTLRLLMSKSLPQQISKFSPIRSGTVTTDNPFASVYDGLLHLRPGLGGRVGEGIYRTQAKLLRQTILEQNLLGKILEQAAPVTREAFLDEFEGFSKKEIQDLLADQLMVEVNGDPLELHLAAFPHPDKAVANALSDALGRAIEALPQVDSSWSWRVKNTRSELPLRIFVGVGPDTPLPDPAPEARGTRPRMLHGKFVFETYVSKRVDALSARIPSGHFGIIEQNGKLVAVRIDSKTKFTVVTPAENGAKSKVEAIEIKWAEGPVGSRLGLYHENGFAFHLHSKTGNSIYSSVGGLSIALTEWTEPDQVRFDDKSLRWYYIGR